MDAITPKHKLKNMINYLSVINIIRPILISGIHQCVIMETNTKITYHCQLKISCFISKYFPVFTYQYIIVVLNKIKLTEFNMNLD